MFVIDTRTRDGLTFYYIDLSLPVRLPVLFSCVQPVDRMFGDILLQFVAGAMLLKMVRVGYGFTFSASAHITTYYMNNCIKPMVGRDYSAFICFFFFSFSSKPGNIYLFPTYRDL